MAGRASIPRRYSPTPATVVVVERAANRHYSPILGSLAVVAVRAANQRYSPTPGSLAVTAVRAVNRRYSPIPAAAALANDANEHETR